MQNLIASSLILAASFAFVGCAADNVDSTQSDEQALTSTAKKVVGDFSYATGQNFYESLSLQSNGQYTASWKPCPPAAKCASHLEEGTWKTYSSNKLKLHPTNAATKSFKLSIAADGSGFKISAGGKTEVLTRDAQVGQAGDFCGGLAGLSCDADLTCVLEGTYPDAGGTCTACPIPSCAAPPMGCHYEASPPPALACPSGCGLLVCDGSGT